MHYRVRRITIPSHNTAKPASQSLKYLVAWLIAHVKGGEVLDYGCGKLRYAAVLAKRCQSITLVDSEEQLSRTQILLGRRTTIRQHVRRWANAHVKSVQQFDEEHKFDFCLCANVLSAIPCRRTRGQVVRTIRRSLLKHGRALFVTQFRNTYFTTTASRCDALRHSDGWILQTRRGGCYYGVIPLGKLTSLLRRNGLRVYAAWTQKESAFVLAGRETEPKLPGAKTGCLGDKA